MPAAQSPDFPLSVPQSAIPVPVPWVIKCEQEPIHRPGAIQSWGALLVVDERDFAVRYASANLADFVGYDAGDVLTHPLRQWIDTDVIRQLIHATADIAPGSVFEAFPICGAAARALVMSGHRMDSALCIEVEPAPPPAHPAAGLKAWSNTRSVVEALHQARDLPALLDIAAREMRRVTGFERVMVLRFDGIGHCEVIAEHRARDLAPFLSLHYPASDVPRQARRLYLRQRVRVIADVGAPDVRLLRARAPGDDAQQESPDLSLAALRAASPIHREYLRHMGVGATIGISLIVDGALWGMLVCQHRAPQTVPPPIRVFSDLIGQVTSLMIGTLVASEARAAVATQSRRVAVLSERLALAGGGAAGMASALAANAADLLGICSASGAIMRIGGTTLSVGAAPGGVAGAALLDALLALAPEDGQPLVCQELGRILPPPQHEEVAGALALPLVHHAGDGLAWLRREQARTVLWGGDPHETAREAARSGDVRPRTSFATWSDQVRGQSLPWTGPQIEAVRALRRELDQLLVRHAEDEVVRLRHHDPLTGLPNRRLLLERLQHWAQKRPSCCLLVVEIDRFKALNDTLGGAVGDALLIQASERIRQVADRPGLLVARIGGDEFAVFSHGAGHGAAEALGEALRTAMAAPFMIADQAIRVTASVGLVLVAGVNPVAETKGPDPHGPPVGADDLLGRADLALQAAKQSGGNCVSAFRSALASGAGRRMEIEQQLRAAIEGDAASAGTFHLAYQPCVALGLAADHADGPGGISAPPPLRGFEALLRWQHPRLGNVQPAEFIVIAEECDLIVPLGQWVLREAIRQVNAWQNVAVGLPPATWRVAVNVSPRQLVQPGFVAGVLAMLGEQDVSPAHLTIEVTEGVFADETATAAVAALHQAGLRIAVDDFGCGYSSLSYLRRLPADELKLDRSFLQRAEDGRLHEKLLAALVQLARAVGLSVLAEGVESDIDLAAVWASGCDAAQGYLFAQPMSAQAAAAWIAAASRSINPAAQRANFPFSFRDVVDVATDAVVVTTAELDRPGPFITYANPAFTRMTGYPLSELLGRSPRLLQGPHTDSDTLRHIGEALRSGREVHERVVNYSSAGERYWVDLSISPLRNEEGRVTHFVAIQRLLPDRVP